MRLLRMDCGIWSRSQAGISKLYQVHGVEKCGGLERTRIDSSRPDQSWNHFENRVC